MDSLIPTGFLAALTEVSARMAEVGTEGQGVGVISLYAQPDGKFRMDNDLLVAGALLHDVGKLVEYEKTPDGKTVKSQLGKDLRHQRSGLRRAGLHQRMLRPFAAQGGLNLPCAAAGTLPIPVQALGQGDGRAVSLRINIRQQPQQKIPVFGNAHPMEEAQFRRESLFACQPCAHAENRV